MKKKMLPLVLCFSLFSLSVFCYGCSASQFEAVLNEVGPAVSTVIQLVALFRGTPADTTPATKVSADVSGIETVYNTFETAEASAKPGLEGQIDAGFVTLNTDLSTIFTVAQVSDPNTEAKISALISLVQTAVGIAEAAIPSPAGKLMAKNKSNLTASELVSSWNSILTAKTGNTMVDQFTAKHKLHIHSKLFRVATLGL